MTPSQFLKADLPRLIAGVMIGLVAGTGVFTFVYAKGASYLSNKASACANCHVMREQFDGWIHSTHRTSATCNDCHTPHDPLGKVVTKARNGFWHSLYFTTGNFHEPIRIKSHNRDIVEHNCRSCHAAVVAAITSGHPDDTSCVRCHGTVGHP